LECEHVSSLRPRPFSPAAPSANILDISGTQEHRRNVPERPALIPAGLATVLQKGIRWQFSVVHRDRNLNNTFRTFLILPSPRFQEKKTLNAISF
jgi:hypothetical protein